MTSNALAGTAVSLRESYAGNLSFELAAGSFRDSSSDPCSVSSTASGNLNNIPFNSEIKAAYLYWAASYNPSTESPDTTVIFNGQSVTDPTPYTEIYDASLDWAFYGGKADITSLIRSTGNATYTMSGLNINSASDSGGWIWDNGFVREYNGHCSRGTTLGGWALVVIYEDDNEPFQVVNIYDGFQIFYGSSLSLIPNNFELSSNPKGKHAHITWEGDTHNSTRNGYDETLLVISQSGSHTLSDSGNPDDNQFNSYSNIYQSNTWGVDVDAYDISTYLSAGETQFTSRYSSGGDMVILSAEVISVSNIPVADLSVTSSTPSAWLESSTVNKTFTITNNGPNDVPTDSVRVSIELEDNLNFNGSVSDSDWVCTNSTSPSGNPLLECTYQNKLRSGWSDYLTLSFDVANAPGNNADLTVTVDHDQAPYDIFDNQQSNDVWSASTPITNIATVDLSASSKTYTNLSGDLILAGDTLQYTITIDDASDLAANNITVTDDLPANISAYTVVSAPVTPTFTAGGANGEGTLTFSGISLAAGTGAGSTQTIILEVTVDTDALNEASLQNTASIQYQSDAWLVDTGNITVVKPDLSASSKLAEDLNGDWVLPGETIRYTITLDDAEDYDLTGVQIIDNMPANIESFSIVSTLPSGSQDFSQSTGGTNGTGFIDLRNISLSAGATLDIQIEAKVANDAADDTPLQNTATITINANQWDIISNDLKVTLSDNTPASGNKPLYLSNSTLSRLIPTTDSERLFNHGDSLTWSISPVLQSSLTLSAGDIRTNLAVEGYRTGARETQLDLTLYYNDNTGSNPNVTIATGTIAYANYRINTIYDKTADLNLPADQTIPAGSSIYLQVNNISDNNTANQWGQIEIHDLNGSFYSQVILNSATVINVDHIYVWDQAFQDGNSDFVDDSGAQIISSSQPDTQLSIRAEISDPFGAFDITDATISIKRADTTTYDFTTDTITDGTNDNNNTMNAIDDSSDDLSTSVKTFEKVIELVDDESIGWWQIEITAYEGNEAAAEQVVHTSTSTFQVIPFLPNITLNKSVKVSSDPINGTANPKAIPEAEILYTIKAINTGRGKSDDGSIILEDEIPENSEVYISHLSCDNLDPELTLTNNNNGPVCFLTGTTPNESGLSLNFASIKDNNDDVWFAQADKDFSYEPDDSSDYDSAIRYIRVKLDGEFNNQAKGSTDEPKFGLTYKVKIK